MGLEAFSRYHTYRALKPKERPIKLFEILIKSCVRYFELIFGEADNRMSYKLRLRCQAVLRVRIRRYVFWHPGSGSANTRYGSGSFYHKAKLVRKNLDTYCFGCIASKSKSKKNLRNFCLVTILKFTDDNSRTLSRIRIRLLDVRIRESWSVPICHGSATLFERSPGKDLTL